MAKFDVIIPVYNTSAYLKACLNSVLNQTFQDFRIIAVDDKSTDSSLEILRRYEEAYPEKIKVIASPINVGPGEARNIALRIADAEYVTFLDSDDTLDLELFEKVKNIIEQHTPDIVSSNIQLNYNGINASLLSTKREINSHDHMIIPMEYKKQIYEDRPALTAKFIKRSLINTEYPSIKWEDYPFAIPYLATAKSIYYLSDIGYYYRINIFGTTVGDIKNFNPKLLDIFTGSDIIFDTMGSELCDYYKKELRITTTMNHLNRLRELCFLTSISKEDRALLANYLVNLINVRDGDFQELEYYQQQKTKSFFYKFRMEMMEKLINPSLQQETDEEVIKQKINSITKKYQR